MTTANERYKAVIYDCDGVMFDSFEANFEFYARILAHFGKAPLDRSDGETMRILHTFACKEVLDHLFSGDSRREEAGEVASAVDYRDLVPLMRMEEGFLETLELLRPRVGLAVCTNRSASMDQVLETFDLSSSFAFVMTASKVTFPKPHPEPLLRVLDHFRIAPSEALFVGDSEVDRLAAAAAEVPFIAYKNALPCAARIDSHYQILPLLDRSF